MSVVIKLIGRLDGRPSHHDNHYLIEAHIDDGTMMPSIHSDADIEHATVFPELGAAMDYWRRQSTTRPLRPDGKPNRPLTAFTIEVERIEGGTHADPPAGDTSS